MGSSTTTKTAPTTKTTLSPAGEKLRKAALAETQARINALEQQETTPATPTKGTVVRGDGRAVRVTVPKDGPGATPAAATPDGGPSPATAAKGKKRAKAKAAKAGKPAKGKKTMGCLDAAAQVLASAKEPMGTKAMVEAMLAKGMWTTSGKTPHATLYAALIRDIAAKGRASRFRKTARGLFAAA